MIIPPVNFKSVHRFCVAHYTETAKKKISRLYRNVEGNDSVSFEIIMLTPVWSGDSQVSKVKVCLSVEHNILTSKQKFTKLYNSVGDGVMEHTALKHKLVPDRSGSKSEFSVMFCLCCNLENGFRKCNQALPNCI